MNKLSDKETLRLFTSNEKLAELWRQQFPGIEVIITQNLSVVGE